MLASSGIALVWLVIASAWAVGRIVGDRFLPTQYLEWVPTVLVVLSGLLTLLAVRVMGGRPEGRAKRQYLLLSALVASVVLWLTFGEWSLWRAAQRPDERPADFRVVFANISPGEETSDLSALFEMNAGVVVLSNVHPNRASFRKIYQIEKETLLERTVGVEPGVFPPDEVRVLSLASFVICSKWPILRYATASVGVQESFLDNDTQNGGVVLMLEIDAPGGRLIVWGVDMPSTLGSSRRELFNEVAERIRDGDRAVTFDEIGRRVVVEREKGDALLNPDIVVGDFNTPSHAWSVSRFRPGLRQVRADTGWGPRGTWPSDAPLWEIDIAKRGPSVRAIRTGRVSVEGCRHLGLWMDLVRYDRALP